LDAPATPDTVSLPPPAPNLQEVAAVWWKIGCLGFGGPAGQIALMHEELVEKRRWISERRYLHALNYCMLLPGPEAQQLATYVGWLMHRTWGGILAGGLFVLPSLFVLIALSWIYCVFSDVPLVAGLFFGIKPAVAAIVLQAAHRIGLRTLKNPILWAIAAASFLAIFVLEVPFPVIVATAALIGWIGSRLLPRAFRSGGGHGSERASFGAAVIDDDTPTPPHARFSWTRLAAVAVGGGLLWLVPMAGLTAAFGWAHTLTQMGWFFTKAALVTFGGAYAVLPYVNQGAVGHYGWLTPTQMIDGLALGETTPGPLIMVVTFVGFVGGWTQAPFGPEAKLLAAVAAAVLVTWFTFLPSFVFIFAGGPLIESTHGNIELTAPLTAITAAVVGVIANLAVIFGRLVLWPAGWSGRFDWISAIIALGAAVALFRRTPAVVVIAACGLVGLGLSLSH
jgi:chromate transporter